jgi:hypothetical protein
MSSRPHNSSERLLFDARVPAAKQTLEAKIAKSMEQILFLFARAMVQSR